MEDLKYTNARDCQHGQLRRFCPHCEYDRDMAEANETIQQLQTKLAESDARVICLKSENENIKLKLDSLYPLSWRCLHTAFVWNDSNFKPAHEMAKETAEELGIKNFDQANEYIAQLPLNIKQRIQTEVVEKYRIEIRDVLEVQEMDGNWNHSPYMLGMTNGLILADSILHDTEPKYRSRPSVWLEDIKIDSADGEPSQQQTNGGG